MPCLSAQVIDEVELQNVLQTIDPDFWKDAKLH